MLQEFHYAKLSQQRGEQPEAQGAAWQMAK
jgi:hypothetical protein